MAVDIDIEIIFPFVISASRRRGHLLTACKGWNTPLPAESKMAFEIFTIIPDFYKSQQKEQTK